MMAPLLAPPPPHSRAVRHSSGEKPSPGKLRPMSAAWIRQRLKPDDISQLLVDHPAPAVLMQRLEAADFVDAALCFAAHALPAREAVWWACRCARHTAADRAPADSAAAEAAEAWVRKPDGAHRARAYAAAQQAQFQSAEALAALAVFWADAELRLSMRAEAAAARLGDTVENAVRVASLRCGPEARPRRARAFLASVRDIDQGGAGHLPPASEA
jgi:hypothetical protein